MGTCFYLRDEENTLIGKRSNCGMGMCKFIWSLRGLDELMGKCWRDPLLKNMDRPITGGDSNDGDEAGHMTFEQFEKVIDDCIFSDFSMVGEQFS